MFRDVSPQNVIVGVGSVARYSACIEDSGARAVSREVGEVSSATSRPSGSSRAPKLATSDLYAAASAWERR
jgi:hypothetical protein